MPSPAPRRRWHSGSAGGDIRQYQSIQPIKSPRSKHSGNMKYECSIRMQQIQKEASHIKPINTQSRNSTPNESLFYPQLQLLATASAALCPHSIPANVDQPPATRRPLEVPPVSGVLRKRRHADACQRGSRKRSNKRATCPPPCRRCSVQPHASRNGLVLKGPT